MSLTVQDLHDMAFKVTKEVLTPENEHLVDLWKAFLGGFVLPKMVEQDPASVEGNQAFKDLINKYSRESIIEMMSPRVVETEKVVEKIIEVEKPVYIQTGEKVLHRRVKSKVNKISRKERNLTPDERDLCINVFNEQQKMLDKDSLVFTHLVDEINRSRAKEDHISASQLAGYWSSLCRMADRPKTKIDAWIEESIKSGKYSLRPYYSDEFVEVIRENYRARKEEALKRAQDHAKIKAGEKVLTTVTLDPNTGPVSAPVDPFDQINFADIV